jgi:hypothetical protein
MPKPASKRFAVRAAALPGFQWRSAGRSHRQRAGTSGAAAGLPARRGRRVIGPPFDETLARGGEGRPGRPGPTRAGALRVRRDLAARGIRLVVVPAPAKACPPRAAGGSAAGGRVRNAPAEWAASCAQGIAGSDPAPLLVAAARERGGTVPRSRQLLDARGGRARGGRARRLRAERNLPPPRGEPHSRRRAAETSVTWRATSNCRPGRPYPAQRVALRPSRAPRGLAARSRGRCAPPRRQLRNALKPSLGWGAAGLGEQLSFALAGCGIASRSMPAGLVRRQRLADELARSDRLAGKRLVIYELQAGSWQSATGADCLWAMSPPAARRGWRGRVDGRQWSGPAARCRRRTAAGIRVGVEPRSDWRLDRAPRWLGTAPAERRGERPPALLPAHRPRWTPRLLPEPRGRQGQLPRAGESR